MTRVLTAALLVFAVFVPCSAGVIASLDGTASPNTQGWTAEGGVVSGVAVTDLGESSWQMSGNNCCGFWYRGLTTQQWTDAFTLGWSFSAVMRLPTTGGVGYIFLDTPASIANRFDLSYGFDGTNGWVGLSNFFDAQNPALKYTFSGNGYHLVDMRYDPGTQSVALWADGIEVLSGYTGHIQSRQGHGPAFGASSFNTALFSQVDFAINDPQGPSGVPEPSSFVLSLVGCGIVALGVRRSG